MIPYYSPNFKIYDALASFFKKESKERTKKFFKEYTNKKYILLTSSCRSALYLSYKAIEQNGSVITSPLTCTSALEPSLFAGKKIFFSDVSQENLNLDPEKIEELPRDAFAIQVSHMGGIPADLDAIVKIAEKNHLLLVEDCAQSFGTQYKNKNVGTYGDVACFSLIKNAYGIGGGILSTNDYNIYIRAKKIQDRLEPISKKLIYFRIIRNIIESYRGTLIGEYIYKCIMTAKSFSIGKTESEKIFYKNVKNPDTLFFKIFQQQKTKFNKLHNLRIANAFKIIGLLKNNDLITCYNNIDYHEIKPSFTKLNILSNKFNVPELILRLNKKGIEGKHLEQKYGSIYQERLDKHNLFKKNQSLYSCVNYFKIHDHFISLPLFETLSNKKINRIINEIKKNTY